MLHMKQQSVDDYIDTGEELHINFWCTKRTLSNIYLVINSYFFTSFCVSGIIIWNHWKIYVAVCDSLSLHHYSCLGMSYISWCTQRKYLVIKSYFFTSFCVSGIIWNHWKIYVAVCDLSTKVFRISSISY